MEMLTDFPDDHARRSASTAQEQKLEKPNVVARWSYDQKYGRKRESEKINRNQSGEVEVKDSAAGAPEVVAAVTASTDQDSPWLQKWTNETIRAEQVKDEAIRKILEWKESRDKRPVWEEVSPENKEVKAYWAQWHRLEVKNSLLCRRWENNEGDKVTWQLVVPRSLQAKSLLAARSPHVWTPWSEKDYMSSTRKVLLAYLASVCGEKIHTDQGSNFESQLFRNLCKLLGVEKTRTTAYHPQSDGMVERFNRTVEEMLSKVVDADQRNWDKCLPLVTMAYRSSVHDSTGISPAEMMLGREIDLPVDLIFDRGPKEHIKKIYVQELEERLHHVHEIARKKLRL
ncbi:Retrovirus-related Pol polyprotein from transposon [Apostichopus japonicus]|uniref:Retrovirus-related Pol polyprotein from transposon n=1 Tax=Stichopus japonicus TaxID=307972 RepID=A0A2G8KZB4_STIJA|nr:Retrovirus-related Pol polyprotein from transposon [Apostichopus japonicus]